jgi:hypothetical protein
VSHRPIGAGGVYIRGKFILLIFVNKGGIAAMLEKTA